jgi:hypothetical protein
MEQMSYLDLYVLTLDKAAVKTINRLAYLDDSDSGTSTRFRNVQPFLHLPDFAADIVRILDRSFV